jgi:DNA-directed RNA polymerase subunit N (RpoN/RPB10)
MEPVRCYECGHPISDKWDAIEYMKKVLLDEQSRESKTDESKKYIDPELNQNLIPLYKTLGIRSYCTRMHCQTSRDIHTFTL